MLGYKPSINKKLLIDRIWKETKYEPKKVKDSPLSSAVTQSSPNDPKQPTFDLENFFNNFTAKCRVTYEPVKALPKQTIKRNLRDQFLRTRISLNESHRVHTQTVNVSQFQSIKTCEIQQKQQIRKQILYRPSGCIQKNKSSRSFVKLTASQSEQRLKIIRKQLKQLYNERRRPLISNQKQPPQRRYLSIKY